MKTSAYQTVSRWRRSCTRRVPASVSTVCLFGIHSGHNNSYLCICPPDTEAFEQIRPLVTPVHDDWETISPEKVDVLINLFDITPQELDVTGISRLQELVLERVALLEVYR